MPAGVGQVHRHHRRAFRLHRGHRQRAEARPGRRRARRGQARRCPAPSWLVQHRPERGSPAVRQRRDPQCALHPLGGMPGQVEQGVNVGHRHGLRPGGHLDDVIPGLDPALAQHPEVESRPVVGDEQRGHPRVVHPDAHPVAGDPGLGHLELRLADPVPVADAHLVIRQAVHREVLPELAVAEVIAAQLLLPVPVGLDLVHEHGAVLPTVPGQVALPIAVDVQPPHQPRALHRPFPYRRVHRPAVPGHVLRQAHVDRQQAAGPPVCDRQLRSSPEPAG